MCRDDVWCWGVSEEKIPTYSISQSCCFQDESFGSTSDTETKPVCRDFAVLEDHSLAYNLQEQEIESHLASNVYKSRLVQNDLQVAKKLQEEEDERAKIKTQKENVDIERQDNEIAQEIQEELVRQAERQRQQEEKDAAIARKLQEKEMKEDRRRHKQLETRFDEDHGGRIAHRGGGSVMPETEYGLNEATKGLTKLDLREQELKDLEVARKLQEEEIKVRKETRREASQMHVRAAQVAQDEEIARLLMEQEKKEYRKNREWEKEKERERLAMERMAVERRRQEGDYRPNSEDVVRPRTREEYEYQRQKNYKPPRPPQPRTHDYENVSPGYVYPDHPAAPRAPARPDPTYRGAYHKR
ncbi:coiled-coil domain-containing protein 50 isoform X2 [Haplochromis burtoni]|uniref:coiled-coil domain-containing protein 50 isoform X2 n=1 Tax=Haplochromis burtoni TaxID=8153 RepID=UPI001C2CDE41|nr:coiled-coil domain-containing protein 50 isoform X2 [Haplochromis burtoni]